MTWLFGVARLSGFGFMLQPINGIMRLCVISCVLGAAAQVARADGTIDLRTTDTHTFVAPIFQPNPANPTIQQIGQPSPSVYSGAVPTGTTVYGGLPATSAYDLVLFYSLNNSVISATDMNVATIVPFRSSATASAAPAGTIFPAPNVSISGGAPGTPIAFAIGAFSVDLEVAGYIASNPGATPSQIYGNAYSDFQSRDPDAEIGFGQIVTNIFLGGIDSNGEPHVEPSTLEGWSSFSLVTNPEPSTWLLSLMGAALILSIRRSTSGPRPAQRSKISPTK